MLKRPSRRLIKIKEVEEAVPGTSITRKPRRPMKHARKLRMSRGCPWSEQIKKVLHEKISFKMMN